MTIITSSLDTLVRMWKRQQYHLLLVGCHCEKESLFSNFLIRLTDCLAVNQIKKRDILYLDTTIDEERNKLWLVSVKKKNTELILS